MSTSLQIDLLMAALSALLPLVPEQYRARAAEIVDAAKAAIAIGDHLGQLAQKLAALRAEMEAMADRAITSEDMDKALNRVREASAAFRAAIETAAVKPI